MSEEKTKKTVEDEELKNVTGAGGEYVERLGSRGMTGRTAEDSSPTDD